MTREPSTATVSGQTNHRRDPEGSLSLREAREIGIYCADSVQSLTERLNFVHSQSCQRPGLDDSQYRNALSETQRALASAHKEFDSAYVEASSENATSELSGRNKLTEHAAQTLSCLEDYESAVRDFERTHGVQVGSQRRSTSTKEVPSHSGRIGTTGYEQKQRIFLAAQQSEQLAALSSRIDETLTRMEDLSTEMRDISASIHDFFAKIRNENRRFDEGLSGVHATPHSSACAYPSTLDLIPEDPYYSRVGFNSGNTDQAFTSMSLPGVPFDTVTDSGTGGVHYRPSNFPPAFAVPPPYSLEPPFASQYTPTAFEARGYGDWIPHQYESATTASFGYPPVRPSYMHDNRSFYGGVDYPPTGVLPSLVSHSPNIIYASPVPGSVHAFTGVLPNYASMYPSSASYTDFQYPQGSYYQQPRHTAYSPSWA